IHESSLCKDKWTRPKAYLDVRIALESHGGGRQDSTSTRVHASQPTVRRREPACPRRAQGLGRGEGNMQPCGGAKWCAPPWCNSSPCCKSAAGCAACPRR